MIYARDYRFLLSLTPKSEAYLGSITNYRSLTLTDFDDIGVGNCYLYIRLFTITQAQTGFIETTVFMLIEHKPMKKLTFVQFSGKGCHSLHYESPRMQIMHQLDLAFY